MDPDVEAALASDKVIDITTTGAQSGQPRRIEIWYHRVDGRYYITGRPGKRSWYANLQAHPDFVFHLKESAQADLPARAIPVTDPAEKRRIFAAAESLAPYVTGEIDAWVAGSPLIEVAFAR